jgi:hypothetical protein
VLQVAVPNIIKPNKIGVNLEILMERDGSRRFLLRNPF